MKKCFNDPSKFLLLEGNERNSVCIVLSFVPLINYFDFETKGPNITYIYTHIYIYINTYVYVCTHTKCQHLPFDTTWIDVVHELLPLRKIKLFPLCLNVKNNLMQINYILIILLYLI